MRNSDIRRAGRTLAGWRAGCSAARHHWVVPAFLAVLCLQGACVGERIVFGSVPPSTFQFTTVIQPDSRGPSGWQVAQVLILLGRLSAVFPRAATCDVEVGGPVITERLGYIPVELAQAESALASDRAARQILQQRGKPTASLCKLFRDTMQYWLNGPNVKTLPGARIGPFRI